MRSSLQQAYIKAKETKSIITMHREEIVWQNVWAQWQVVRESVGTTIMNLMKYCVVNANNAFERNLYILVTMLGFTFFNINNNPKSIKKYNFELWEFLSFELPPS